MKKVTKIFYCILGALLLISVPILIGGYDSSVEASTNDYQTRFNEITDSKLLTNKIIVSGKVFQKDGKTVADGATIQLYAWPNADAFSKLKTGDSFTRTPIAKTITNKDGSYMLRIDPNLNMKSFWNKDGFLDCELVAITDTGFITYSFSSVQTDGEKELYDLVKDIALFDSQQNEVIKSVSVDLTLGEKPKIDLVQANSLTPSALSEQLVQTYSPQWVNVGQIYISGSGKTAKLTYKSDAQSSIGVGYSLSGTSGTFIQSGTISKSSTSAVGFPKYTTTTGRYMDTQYSFAKYRVFTEDGSWYYLVKATSYAGGARTSRSSSIPTANYCVSQPAGTTFSRESSTASTISNGVQISTIIGIDLSSRTGFSSTANLDFEFVTAGTICGTNGYPGATPGRIVIKN